MAAPDILPCLSNWISTNLPKRLSTKHIKQSAESPTMNIDKSAHYYEWILAHLELLFLTVFALPKASRTGFDWTQI